jgi:cold-inducible RNA-binding protein
MKMKSLYVGNLDSSTTEHELRHAFAVYGDVQVVSLITDHETGRPRGFAFVEMESDKEAQEALLALNGATLGGTTLTVNEARPKAVRSRP